MNIFVEKGLPARVARASAAAVNIESELKKNLVKRPADSSLLASLSSTQYRLALYDLANSGKLDPKRVDFDKEMNEAEAELKDISAGGGTFFTPPGALREGHPL